MKKFLIMMLMTLMSFGISSCASSQTIYVDDDYEKVYFDHVVYGYVNADTYIYDGTYSYHILGRIPVNAYWELYPIGLDVYLYSSQMVRLRLFEWTRRSIFYNRMHYRYHNFDYRHRPPHQVYHNHHYGGHNDVYHRPPHVNHNNGRPNMNHNNHNNHNYGRPNMNHNNTQRPSVRNMQSRPNINRMGGNHMGGQRHGGRH